jgi:hypothetical protein
MLTRYEHVVIDGINWEHGATYSRDDANALLGTSDENNGLTVRFSKPVLKSTLDRPGIVDLWVLQGGRGQRGDLIYLTGEFVEFGETPGHPDQVEWFRYRQTTDEDVNYGDRVLIIIRSAFILDSCCRPVDGAHIGGRVPLLEEEDAYSPTLSTTPEQCVEPPWLGFGPWTSGYESPGSTFESWFYIEEKHHEHHDKHHKDNRSSSSAREKTS